MKKVFFVMVLAGCLAGGVFAQKMAIALDAAPLVRGFIAGEDTNTSKKSYISLSPVFEYALGNNYVIGARADIILGKVGKGTSVSVNHYGLAFLGRWYPLANLQKLYLGAELGFDTCSMEKVDDPLYRGLTLGLRAGWKQMMG
ncbi:MAG: hypothetical protein LBG84_09450, partial [Treponema sp.]|nr:hypothetical protein [Treponema sp.]